MKGNYLGHPAHQTVHEMVLCIRESIPCDGLLSTLTIVNNMTITIKIPNLGPEIMKCSCVKDITLIKFSEMVRF